MAEYYKLSFLRNIEPSASRPRGGSEWEEIYLEIDGNKSRVVVHTPQTRATSKNKLEKISKKEVDKILDVLSIDFGH